MAIEIVDLPIKNAGSFLDLSIVWLQFNPLVPGILGPFGRWAAISILFLGRWMNDG